MGLTRMSEADRRIRIEQRKMRQKNYFVHEGKSYDATSFELRTPHTRTDALHSTLRPSVRLAPNVGRFRRIRETDELDSETSSTTLDVTPPSF
mmetsp:Transcript_13154/g.40478  ORF Transcript_13154/g.40478 Transcript_13154/m.40478 type:complete len:93 (+) Transcript_13154:136-414(+)